jgi:VanZ family protein
MLRPDNRLFLARALYVGLVLIATLLRLEFTPDLHAAGERLWRALTPNLRWGDAVDAIRNLTLFAGLGAVWIVTSVSSRLAAEIRRATLAGLALSALVEGLQLFSPVRFASIMDIVTNGLGALAGAAGTGLLVAAVQRSRGRRSYFGVPIFLLAGGYAVAIVCEAITPLFRSGAVEGVRGGPFTRLRVMLALAEPLERWQVPWLDVPLYACAAFFAVMYLTERGGEARAAWRRVAVVAAALALVLEPAHGLLGISVRWEAAITHVLALVLGAWAAARLLPPFTQRLRGPVRARAALLGYAALLVLWGWRPLLPRTDGSEIASQLVPSQFIPMQSLAMRTDVFSAMHVAQQFFLYLPLGALLAVWPLRRRGALADLWPALVLAMLIEIGHLFIVDRTFDVTNALLAWAGLAVGWVIVRRSGYAPYGEALGAAAPPAR